MPAHTTAAARPPLKDEIVSISRTKPVQFHVVRASDSDGLRLFHINFAKAAAASPDGVWRSYSSMGGRAQVYRIDVERGGSRGPVEDIKVNGLVGPS